MALTVTPEVWAAELLVALERAQVYASPLVVNRKYEGDISGPGDTVHVPNLTDPTIRSYAKHTDLTIDEIDDGEDTWTIDQAKYFAFEVDDLEKKQQLVGGQAIAEQSRRAAYLLRTQVDTYVAGLAAAGASVKESEVTLADPAEAYETLVLLSQRLDENDVPEDGRFAVVSPDFYSQLLLDSRFVGAGTNGAVLTNGVVGQSAGFTIVKSNNAPDGAGDGKIQIAGNNTAISYAEALTQIEADRMEKRFADLVKGLLVYGAKVWRPEALVTADVITQFTSS